MVRVVTDGSVRGVDALVRWRHPLFGVLSFDLASVSAVLAMTDGVANGVQRYGTPADWRLAAEIAVAESVELIPSHWIWSVLDPRHRF